MLSVVLSWLTWLLFAAAFIVLPVALRLFADDRPRRGEPPDSDGEDPALTGLTFATI